MKLAIVGSRNFDNYKLLCETADKFQASEIISGGAKGADTLAEKYARERNLKLKVFLPKFKTEDIPYHPRYFHIRNREIVNYADHVLAFMCEGSRGTKSTVQYACKINKPVTIINVPRNTRQS